MTPQVFVLKTGDVELSSGDGLKQGLIFFIEEIESLAPAIVVYDGFADLVEISNSGAGIERRAEDYPWSSAAAHCGLHDDPLLCSLPGPRSAATTNWSEWLADTNDDRMLAKLRLHTRTGRPVGDDRFIADLELRLGRRVHAWAVGRPKRPKPVKAPCY